MNFAQLVAEVILLTKRPDLTARIESAVRAATLKAHYSSFYYKDLKETGVQFAPANYVHSFDPRLVMPQFRKVKYIRDWAGGDDYGTAGRFFTDIQVENSLDSYGCQRTYVFYMAGELLQLRSAKMQQFILFGAYVHPVVTPDNSYSSWISTEYPFAIVYEAASSIFSAIGMKEAATDMKAQVADQYRELTISCQDTIPI